MTKRKESELIKKYRERIRAGGLPEGVKVVVRLTGGMPSERLEHEFELTGEGKASVSRLDELSGVPRQAASGELDLEEARQLLQQIDAGIPGMVRRGEAHFLPDTVVGIITVEVDGKAETFYFPAETFYFPAEEARVSGVDAAFEPSIRTALQIINQISDRLLMESGGQDHE
jgi:hypothetical protein